MNATGHTQGRATLTRRRRRTAQREAQIRGRRFVALVFVALVSAAAVVLVAGALRAGAATPSGAATSSGAGALLSSLAGTGVGDIFDDPSVAADDATVNGSRKSADLSFSDGTATVRSSLVGDALSSESDVSLSDVSLLGGLVTARSVELVATADAGPSSADASAVGSYVVGLKIKGQPVAAGPGDLPIPGVGTLTVLSETVDPTAPAPRAVVGGLELTLDQPVGDLAAGSVIVVGRATAAADSDTAAALVALAAKQSEPTPLPTPRPTPRPAPTPTSKSGHGGATGGNSSSSGGKSSSAGGGSSGASGNSSSGGSVADSTMAPPAPPSKKLLARFPGAVFPVKGAVNYTDTFGAYRADMKGHRHEGNDIFAKMGTPIVAVLAGTIRYSTYGIGGNNAHLTDARGDYFYYAHMVRFAAGLKSGDHVHAGEVIGYVGETGDAAGTSPHCHFEIHPNGGAAIDPYPYLEAWRAAATGVVPAAVIPVTNLTEAGVGIPLAEVLARRGVIVGVEFGRAGAALGRRMARSSDLPQLNALELLLFVSSLGGITAIKRLREPAMPPLLANHETVVRRTIVIAERTLTKS
jgi:murein DD-endopeptidase MepM/ murein hydrolase activator NlpD